MGVAQSMGRVGSCFDSAVSEAFTSVLKVEYVHRRTFTTRPEARIRSATWITDSYNARRLHSVCGWKSPIDYEHDCRAGLAEELAAQEGLHETRGLTLEMRLAIRGVSLAMWCTKQPPVRAFAVLGTPGGRGQP
ncbi:integrase core domain-containing protein [Streptomyces goshikiensis]